MSEKKGIAYYKDWIYIISFIIMFGGILISWSNGRTQRALIDDQVKRNTQVLTEYDLKLIDYKLELLLNLLDE